MELSPELIELHVIRGHDGAVTDGSVYAFPCPECREIVGKPADERVVELLRSGGVTSIDETELDGRPGHPEDPPSGPPFTVDDLLDLHLLLARSDWFDQLVLTAA